MATMMALISRQLNPLAGPRTLAVKSGCLTPAIVHPGMGPQKTSLTDTGTPGGDVDEGAIHTGGPGEGSTDESDPAWDTAIPDDSTDGIDAVDEGDEADMGHEIDTGSSLAD